MTTSPKGIAVVRTITDLRATVAGWRADGHRIALVPTMGALHDGHLGLVRASFEDCSRTVVSLFVNPTQFGPSEDFSVYPRQEAEDISKLDAIGTHLLYAPSADIMYPAGFATSVTVAKLTDRLCGLMRPGHFTGVATVVTKLLMQVLPDQALFGEKDYQQLQVIRRLVKDLDIPVQIKGVPTVRDAAGLALSSRNSLLTPAELTIAKQLNLVLGDVAAAIRGQPDQVRKPLLAALDRLQSLGFAPIDYLELVDSETLEELDHFDRPARLMVAGYLGRTRLIDNLPL